MPSVKVADKETTGTQVDTTQPSNVAEIKPRMKRSVDVAEVAEKEVVGEAKATGTDVTSKVTLVLLMLTLTKIKLMYLFLVVKKQLCYLQD